MNTKLSTVALVVAAVSFNANAIVGGTPENKANFQQFVEMNCTGNIIGGGKWVLTAAHCSRNLGMRDVNRYDGSVAKISQQVEHPAFDGFINDIGLWEFQSVQDVNQINVLNPAAVPAGQQITAYGFGGTAPLLNKAVQTTTAQVNALNWLDSSFISQGHSTGGDSGMSWLNTANEIVSVHVASSSAHHNGMQSFRLELGRQFILDTVNAWHFPTNLTFNGAKTITVQSLHVGGTTDAAYTTGDLNIDYAASTCDDAPIAEYGTCTYSVTSAGGHGQLHLSATEIINVNKPTPQPPVTNPSNPGNSGGSGGGGSLGLFSGLLLAMVGLRRRMVRK